MKTERIYLDNASTTNLGAEVLNAMLPVLTDTFGDSTADHSFGRDAYNLINQSKETIAKFINAKADEVYFTSSGSEANSWAIIGLAQANSNKGNHIITTQIEHPSILEACNYLEHNGYEVTYLKVDSNGFVNFVDLLRAIKSTTILVSIGSANHEIGTIQNIKAIAHTVHEKGAIFHTDAAQLFGHMQLDVEDLGIDALTLSAHKIYGPKGVGALYVSNNVKISPIIFGGNQEQGKRGGISNTAGIVGFAKAVEIAHRDMRTNNHKLRNLAEYFTTHLTQTIQNIVINANIHQKLPHIISVTFIGVDGDSLMAKLDMQGVAISLGGASSTSVSHVIKALGVPTDNAKATVRFSLGKNNSYEELDKAVSAIAKSVQALREYSSTYGMKIRKRKGDSNV